MKADGLNVEAIAPVTPELVELARRRTHEIVKEFGREMSIWGTTKFAVLADTPHTITSIPDLAVACYAQGVRDTAAVNAVHISNVIEAAKRVEPWAHTMLGGEVTMDPHMRDAVTHDPNCPGCELRAALQGIGQ